MKKKLTLTAVMMIIMLGFFRGADAIPCDMPGLPPADSTFCQAYFDAYTDSTDFMTWYFIDLSFTEPGTIPAQWLWDFGDGTSSGEQNPVHTYTETGTYTVCLTITDNSGTCQDTFCKDLDVTGYPPVNCENYFMYITNDNLTFTFTGFVNSPDECVYLWNFGDNTTGSGQNVTHTFQQTGVSYYNVCLQTITMNNNGDTCAYTSCQQVFVGNLPGCQAMFFYYPLDSLNENLEYQFQDVSFGNPTLWYWDFGDGTTSDLQNPVHTFAEPGTYLVCLTISDDSICQDMSCQNVIVGMPIPGDCSNFFTYTVQEPCTVTFTGEAYYNGMPVEADSYVWEFGDGTTGTGQTVTHTYNPVGSLVFNVCLMTEITEPSGATCSALSCQDVWITNNTECLAQFQYYPYDSLNLTHTYQFLDISWGNPDTWLWDFGDGTTSGEQNPVHTFPDYGLYNVCLTISNTEDSCFNTHCETVFADTIPDNCESYFTYQVQDLTVSFEGHSLSFFPLTWEWQFGDGTGGEGPAVTHTYIEEGSYTVTLVTTDESGCTWSSTQTVTVGSSPSYTLFGQVIMGNTIADIGSAILYRMDDPAGGIYIVDVQYLDSAGMYHFTDVEPGAYLILAELAPGSAGYGEYLPTYYGDVVFWGDATVITLGEPQNPYDIHLVAAASYSSGPGTVTGMITQDLEFSGRGTPAQNIEILLINHTGQVIALNYSAADGTFTFPDLALGIYDIYAEVPGKNTIPATVTLDDLNATVNVEIVITGDQVNQLYGINDPEKILSMHVGEVYPDPVNDEAFIPIECSGSVTAEITLFNQMGQRTVQYMVILHQGDNIVPIKTKNLPEGIYLLKLTDSRNNLITRKFIK